MSGVRRTLIAALAGLAAGCGPAEDRGPAAIPGGPVRLGSVETPAHPPRVAELDAFRIAPAEVTVAMFLPFLAETDPADFASPQVSRDDRGRWRPRVDPRLPVTHVSVADAEAWCAWRTRIADRRHRLPTPDEWEAAARGGIDGARYPWGWNPPEGRAHVNAEGPALAASFAPNRYGLHDPAGNVAEWAVDADGTAWLLGGSWADRDPAMTRVDRRVRQRPDYRGPDAGFRFVVDAPNVEP